MQRYKLIIEYRGTGFAGWQRQVDAYSIQQAIEEAITGFCQQDVCVYAAGRTDAGVHARGQAAHVDLAPLKTAMSGFDIMKAINAHLQPHPIVIVDVLPVDHDFHARFDARNKLYHYRVVRRGARLSLDKGLAWHFKRPLDIAAMREGARFLLGHHDFTSFRDAQCQAKSPMRTLDRLDIAVKPYDEAEGQEIIFAAEGQSFLHHQVRNMVGTLVMAGEHKIAPDSIKYILTAKDRRKAGPTAPADGLYLMRVDYS